LTNETLADRIITYCDALAAFSLVNALAFVITLAESDIRCSIAYIALPVMLGNLFVAAAVTVGLVLLRRFEQSLRAPGSQDPRVVRFWRLVQGLRVALVWGVLALELIGLHAATLDPSCAAGPLGLPVGGH
jgi:hypothetical protein